MAKSSPDIEVAVAEVVDYLRITGGFAPALREVVQRKVTADAAKSAGLKVTKAQLQKASDAWRLANGLNKATDTEAWLAANGVTVDALEDYLETNLLMSKLKDQLEEKTAKKKFLASEGVKESVRQMIYADWLAKAMK